MVKKIRSEPQWTFNFILAVLVALIGYFGMRMDTRIDLKADKDALAAVCTRMDLKVDKSYLDRVDSGLQTQIGRLANAIDRLNSSIDKNGNDFK